ncbi:MAG: hypothetical protein DRQ13_01460 [Ignavibacteriae bacterium]|nr:MAG: hypothetical protein DRQ13_01460 [Ignavibacteriota bacterium]
MHKSILKIVIALSFLLFFTTSLSIAQDNFQGKVTFEVSDEGQNQQISYFVKGNKFLIQPEDGEAAGQGSMIYDGDKKAMIIIMTEQKMYMEMPVDPTDEISNNESAELDYFVKTGNSKDVMGYSCDEFEFKDEDRKGLALMTKELGSFLFMDNPEGGGNTQWQEEIMSEGYFPMLVKEENSSGKLETVFKVIDLELMKLDDKMFSVPPGFTKFDMPNMQNMK